MTAAQRLSNWLSGEAGDGFGTGPGVDAEGADVPVAALGITADAPPPAKCVSDEWRSWWRVHPLGVSAGRCRSGVVTEPGLAGRAAETLPGGRW